MFDKVLVGIDEHQGGRDAIALAKVLAGEGATLTFTYVYDDDAHVWRGSSPPFEASERERARKLIEDAALDAGGRADVFPQGAPSVGRGLHDAAEAVGADLIVVGSSRRGLFGRVFLADDTRSALNGAPCAVAVAPAGYAKESAAIRRIGVGYDGSPESVHALKVARSLAVSHNATVAAIEAVSAPAYVLAAGDAGPEAELDLLLRDAAGELAELDGVEAHATYGNPADELSLFGDSVDLLVVGSRSYGPLGRLVHGSTSQKLARTARCPLLVLTRAVRAAEPASTWIDERGTAAETRA
jgi:nucleotide-binding universal stress UspA family protein